MKKLAWTKLTCIALPLAVAALLVGSATTWADTSPDDAGIRAADSVPVTPVTDADVDADTAASSSNMGLLFFVFVLAIFLGVELISKVPSQLHTPLMSGSNAISGISIVGALLAVRTENDTATLVLGTIAVALAMINVVGGYTVTDRMLGMFKHKSGGAQ